MYIKEREKIASAFEKLGEEVGFDELSMLVFRFQFTYNSLYQKFCKLLERTPLEVKEVSEIPFLPISFFKTHKIKTGQWESERIFGSSGTTGSNRSEHHIKDLKFYLDNSISGFEQFYGQVEEYCFLGILPGYQARTDSSLVYMVNHMISKSLYPTSGFYLNREEELLKVLEFNHVNEVPTVLFGVSFALLELTKFKLNFPGLIVIETGGMKNSKIELTKKEITERLRQSLSLNTINSEYGMTELMSQSYSLDGLWYSCAHSKRVIVAELRDPLEQQRRAKTGILKVIDLANFDTCSFIETQDLGLMNDQGYFQVQGRMQNAELRGCNLLLDDPLKYPIR